MNLDAAYTASLGLIPDGNSKTAGISVGESVAALILALRSEDGSAITLPYKLAPGPGIYQPDPAALFVAWGNVTPFALKSGSQFRAEGPPALSSDEYAADYNEVKNVGVINSTTRTPDQTEAALFWMPSLQIIGNDIARIAAAAHRNSLSENARLFALLNIAIADTAIAGMDTKYTYNFWRPREAIHAGDADANDDTIADPAWAPLVYIGVHPDYVSQHSAVGGAVAQVLARFFGTDHLSFSITTSTAPGRMVMLHPCPAPGTMNQQAVESVEKLMPSKTQRNVAVIAYTELNALQADLLKTIPFYGLLTGMAYIGHAVWVFEGHSSALAAGCREADLLIADCEMAPFLAGDWMTTACSVMRRKLIFAHDRATFSLRRLYPNAAPPP